MIKELEIPYVLPMNKLLDETTHKLFFTQEEFEKNYGKIIILSALRIKIEKEIKEKKI